MKAVDIASQVQSAKLIGDGNEKKALVIVNAKSGRLADTDFSLDDKAAQVCPVGVILKKRQGFAVPIGERTYDKAPIGETVAEGK